MSEDLPAITQGYFERPVRDGETLMANGISIIFYRDPKKRRDMVRIVGAKVKILREVTSPVALDSAESKSEDTGIDP